jgi:hypothetical protein
VTRVVSGVLGVKFVPYQGGRGGWLDTGKSQGVYFCIKGFPISLRESSGKSLLVYYVTVGIPNVPRESIGSSHVVYCVLVGIPS